MTPVSAEAEKNIRSVVELMRKILLIDKGHSSVRRFRKSLESRGYSIVASDNLKKSFPIINKGDIEL